MSETKSLDDLIAAANIGDAPAPEQVPAEGAPAQVPETPPADAPVVEGQETPAPAPTPEPEAKPQDDLARRAQALMKQEGENVRRHQELRKQEKEFATAKQAAQDLESLRALAAENPLALIERFGVKLDDVKARIAEAENTDPNAVLRRRVEAMEKQRADEAEQAKKSAEQRQVEENVARHKREIASFVGQNAEKFELVAAFGDEAVDMVQQTVIRHLQRTQELLSPEQAAGLVEEYLEKNRVEPALKTKKVTGRFKPAETPKPATPGRTLDNGMTSTPTVQDGQGMRPGETSEDYFERLLREKPLR